LRYRVEMKKRSTTKLAVRRETLRALSNMDLARAAGGDAVMLPESGDKGCLVLVAPLPPGA
jgi:Holliday junction resolvase